MDHQELRTLQLLEELEKDHMPSQRDLARKLNVSLGLVNSFVKRLAHKGYFKITTIPKNRVKYILTPQGVAEKTRLTYEFIQHSFVVYKRSRNNIRTLLKVLEKDGVKRIVLYGANDLAEIAYLSLQESDIELVAVLDDKKDGQKFLSFTILDPNQLFCLNYDKIIITALKSREMITKKLLDKGVKPIRIETLA